MKLGTLRDGFNCVLRLAEVLSSTLAISFGAIASVKFGPDLMQAHEGGRIMLAVIGGVSGYFAAKVLHELLRICFYKPVIPNRGRSRRFEVFTRR